jgi:putative PIN family toxin of toxin-antitoxin system
MYQVVLDTNILVAAMRSRLGVSNFLLTQLGGGRWRPNLTVALFLEYEAVLKRNCVEFGLTEEDIDEALDAICSQSGLHRIYFQWRPAASDPNDEMVLEAAIASHSDFIITYNKRDFAESKRFGIQCHTPKEFLILLEELP